MDSIEPKKLAILRILQIFEMYSDSEHPLTQQEIIEKLEEDFGLIIERKTIGSNVSLLKEAGFNIETCREGSYLAERKFEDSELRLLIDGILSSKHITAVHSKELIKKLRSMSNKYFRSRVKHIYSVKDWNKTENCELFLNIDLIDEAIEGGKQISFNYNKYGEDKYLHKSAWHRVSPYQLILHSQKYYLMALNEWHKNIGYYRLDHITNITIRYDDTATPIRQIKGFENGIDYSVFSTSLPYMYTDTPQGVEFYADKNIIDHVIEWFGKDIIVERCGERMKVTAKVSLMAMEYWAMQYLNSVEIISPTSLRNKIKTNIAEAIKKYNT